MMGAWAICFVRRSIPCCFVSLYEAGTYLAAKGHSYGLVAETDAQDGYGITTDQVQGKADVLHIRVSIAIE